jgi:anion-transporting  ArsA/GET3 family ATPase
MAVLSQQRLLVISGKGGVGKSTVAAALALASSRAGLRTLVCEINVKERIPPLLGHQPAGPELRELEKNLWAVGVRPEQAMREYALMVLRFQTVYRAVFENRFVRYFLRFIPSVQELVMIGKVLYHLQERRPDGSFRFERIVMDAPATGHAISFLSIPTVLLETVPPGPLSREARTMRDLLADPAISASVLVSLPEEMPINETLELHAALQSQAGLHTSAVVLNMFVPARFLGLARPKLSAAMDRLVRAHLGREEQSEAARARLRSGIGRPVLTVPRLFVPGFDRAAVEAVVGHLGPLWGAR